LFSLAICMGGAFAAALAQPSATLFGRWEWALAVLAAPAVLCALFWRAVPTFGMDPGSSETKYTPGSAVFSHPVAWALCMHMALQSLSAHATASWLPTWLHENGVRMAGAGCRLSALMMAQVLSAVSGAWLAGRYRTQGGMVISMYLLALVGIA